jgi:cytochrome c biogenesis protein CcmG/thiol:disulfide interchange protein DsbE
LEIAETGTVILGINIKDDKKNAVSYLQNYNNPFQAVSYDPNGRTAIDWGVTAPPETFIIDKDGKVLFRFAGPLVGQDYLNRFLPAYESALTKK